MKRPLVFAVVGLAMSLFVVYTTTPPISDPKIDSVLADLVHLRRAMDERLKQGLEAPDDSKGLRSLLHPPGTLGKLPKDPWGSDYLYKQRTTTHGYTIYSAGKNGVNEQGAGDDVTDRTKFYSCNDYEIGCPMDFDEIVFIAASVLALLFFVVVAALTATYAVRRMRVRRAA